MQAMEEALEELKKNNQSLQTNNVELKMYIHEEKEEKHNLLLQLQVEDEALENLQRDPCEVKSISLNSCMCPNDDFTVLNIIP